MRKIYTQSLLLFMLLVSSSVFAQVTNLQVSSLSPCPDDDIVITWDNNSDGGPAGGFTVTINSINELGVVQAPAALMGQVSPFVYTVSNGHTYTFTVDGPNAGGAATTASVVTSRYPTAATGFTLNAAIDNMVCAGELFTLVATGATMPAFVGTHGAIKWYDATGTTLLQGGDATLDTSILANTTFKVRVEDTVCDSNTAFFDVMVNVITPATNVSINGGLLVSPANICVAPGTYTLTANATQNGGGVFNWSAQRFVSGVPSGPAVTKMNAATFTEADLVIAQGDSVVYTLSLDGSCNNNGANIDTTFVIEGYVNTTAVGSLDDLEFSIDGGDFTDGVDNAVNNTCDGDYRFRIKASTINGNNPNTSIQFVYRVGLGPVTPLGAPIALDPTLHPDSFYVSTTTVNFGAASPPQYRAGIQVTDACSMALIPSVVTNKRFNVQPLAVGATPQIAIRDENNIDYVTTATFCSGETLDFRILTSAGTNGGHDGRFMVHKSLDGGLTKTLVAQTATSGQALTSLTFVGVGANADVVTQTTTYYFSLVSSCDSLPIGTIGANIFNQYQLDTVRVLNANVVSDSLACDGQSLNLRATLQTPVGNDGPVTVEFFRNAVPSLDGAQTSVGMGIPAGNNYNLTGVAHPSTGDFYYLALLTSTCGTDTVVSHLIGTHDAKLAPDDINSLIDGNNDLISDMLLCPGDTFTLAQVNGNLGNDGSEYRWNVSVNGGAYARVAETAGFTIVDTSLTQDSSVVFITTPTTSGAIYRFRVAVQYGQCANIPANPAATFRVNVAAISDLPTSAGAFEVNSVPSEVAINDVDSVCTGNAIRTKVNATIVGTDNATLSYYVDGIVENSVALVSGLNTYTFTALPSSTNQNYKVVYSASCIDSITIDSLTIKAKLNSVQVTGLSAKDEDGDVLLDNAQICTNNNPTYTANGGTLGDKSNFEASAPVYAWSLDGFTTSFLSTDSVVTYDQIANGDGNVATLVGGITGSTTVSVRVEGGCNLNVGSATHTLNTFGPQDPYTLISADVDNFCANISQVVNLSASGNTIANPSDSVVWYTIDDQGNAITKLQSRAYSVPNANQLVASPMLTTTYGVRIEGCDTTIFEVRTITVKDTANADNTAFSPTAPQACPGGLVTVNYNGAVLGSNGVIRWYASQAGMPIAAGQSVALTAPVNAADSSYFVRIEGDCDTTAFDTIKVKQSAVVPNNAILINNSGATEICADGSVTLNATNAVNDFAQNALSHIWSVSFDNGGSYNVIPDADSVITYNAFAGANFVNGQASVRFRVQRTNGCVTTPAVEYNSLLVNQLATEFTSVAIADNQVCVGQSISATANGGILGRNGMVRWVLDGLARNELNGQTSVNLATTGLSAGVHTIGALVVSTCNTTDTTFSTFTIDTPPTASTIINGVDSVCDGTPFTLTAAGYFAGSPAGTFSWSVSKDGGNSYLTLVSTTDMVTNFSGFTGLNVAGGLDSLLFRSSLTNLCGTTGFTAKKVMVKKRPVAFTSLTVDDQSICAGETVTFTAVGGDKGYDGVITWSFNGLDNPTFNNQSSISLAFNATTVVRVRYVGVDCGSTAEQAVTVTVTPLPTNDITAAPTELCGNVSINLDAFTGGDGLFSNVTPATAAFNEAMQSFNANLATVGDYTFDYTRTVGGCSQTFSYTLSVLSFPVITANDITKVNPTACAANGSIVINTVNGGNAPYSYSIGGVYQVSNIFSGLGAQNASVTVRDVNMCTSAPVVVSLIQPGALAAARSDFDSTVSCFGETSANFSVVVSGGVAPYTVTLSGAGSQVKTLANAGSVNFSGLGVGSYNVLVSDVNNCTFSFANIITVTGVTNAIDLVVEDFSDVSCFGNEDGSISFRGIFGSGSYTYSFDGGAFSATNDYNDLAAGTYNIIVADNGGCQDTFVYTINTPSSITIDTVTTFLNNTDGYLVTFQGNGGTGVLKYSVDGGNATTLDTYTLTLGNHTVVVTDENGCSNSLTFTLTGTIGITKANNITLTAYPNPFNGTLVVEGAGANEINLFDIYGKQVNVTMIKEGNRATLYTDNLAKGMYILSVTGEGVNATQKVIKN